MTTLPILAIEENLHAKLVINQSIEFFYNSSFPAKSWQDPASIYGEEQNKKLPIDLAKTFIKSHALLILEIIKVQHVKWCMKQTKLTSEISFTTDSLLTQSVEH